MGPGDGDWRPFTLTAPQLAQTTGAALWILLDGICSVVMNVLIRVAAQAMHPFEIAFFRCFFGLVIVIPWIIKGGPGLLRSPNAGFCRDVHDLPDAAVIPDADAVRRTRRPSAGSEQSRTFR